MIDSSSLVLHDLIGLGVALATAARSRSVAKHVDQALCDAASRGDLAEVKRLLARGVSENSADEDGTTALMAAAFAGEASVVRLLLAQGADPDLQDESGLTALMNAVIGEGEMDLDGSHSLFLEIVEILLEAGADPGLKDETEQTAGGYADAYGLSDYSSLVRGGEEPEPDDL